MQRSDDIDGDIILRHQEGDPLALGELDKRYRSRVYAYCSRLLNGDHQAEDIVQTTFTKAFLSIHTLQTPGAFRGWLFTIARNEVYGAIRSKDRNAPGPMTEDVFDPETPIEILDRMHTVEAVDNGLSKLRLPYREIIILRHFEGMTYAEIAALTGNSIATIESRLHKARRALAKLLKPLWDERRAE